MNKTSSHATSLESLGEGLAWHGRQTQSHNAWLILQKHVSALILKRKTGDNQKDTFWKEQHHEKGEIVTLHTHLSALSSPPKPTPTRHPEGLDKQTGIVWSQNLGPTGRFQEATHCSRCRSRLCRALDNSQAPFARADRGTVVNPTPPPQATTV